MRNRHRRTIPALKRAIFTSAAVTPALFGAATFAASGTWSNNTGNADANWSTGTNWNLGNIPGVTSLTTGNTEVATFGTVSAGAMETPFLDGDRRLGQINFDNAQADYNLAAVPGAVLYLQSGNHLVISNGGATTLSPHLRLGATTGNWNTGTAAVTLLNGFSTTTATAGLSLTGNGGITVQGNVFNAGGTTLLIAGSNNLTIAGNVTDGAGGAYTLSSNGGTSQNYTGTMRLEGNNSFSGTITWRTGTLVFASENAEGSGAGMTFGTANTGSSGVAILIDGPYTMGRTVALNNDANSSVPIIGGINTSGTATYSNTITIANRAGGWQFTAAAGGTVDFSGLVAGGAAASGIVNKIGDGTIRFTRGAGNSYAGNTTVSAGTLLITNTTGSGTGSGGTVNVIGGTFGGTGIATNAVNVAAGAKLRAGEGNLASTALRLNGNLTLQNDSILQFVLDDAAGHSTLTRTGGTWTFDADQKVDILYLGAVTAGQTYNDIITGLAPGTFAGSSLPWQIITPYWAGNFTYDGTTVDLFTTATPEPGSLSILVLGGLCLLRRRRVGRMY